MSTDVASYNALELIANKRDGGELDAEQLAWLVDSYTANRLPDYQMAAFLMAVLFVGMTSGELAAWTEAMLHSGETLDLGNVGIPKVDKHSTGGVGDKVSIPLQPAVAACGVAVPMISGRGLGHTGGTLDKLESIPGFRTALDPDEFVRQLDEIGIVLAGQSETLVPADRYLYALRDATATVPSIPLIASSIMSKKLAEDIDGLVLDVKIGSGGFMKSEDEARVLAETMIDIGAAHQTPVVAVLTNMDQPLGEEVGNANEIAESIAVLKGDGPPDLVSLVYRLGEEMLQLAGVAATRNEARERLEVAIDSGKALDTFRRVVVAQGGNPDVVDDTGLLPRVNTQVTVDAATRGFLHRCDALAIGRAAVRLGAGRARKEDAVDPEVGLTIHHKVGDQVESGEPLATIRYRDPARRDAALDTLAEAWLIAEEPPQPRPLILGELR